MAKRLSLELAGPSSSREERIAENRTKKLLDGDDREIFDEIASGLSCEQWQMFGRKLGLSTNDLKDLERESVIYQYGREFKIVRMLEKWKSKANPDEDQLVPLLTEALRSVHHNDIAYSIEQKLHHGSHDTISDLQNQMKVTQRNSFTFLLLPRDLWLTKKRLLLEELYVKLTMMSKNKKGEKGEKEIGIEEIFDEIESKIPRRILIEGQPGYGKTTLVTKLLSDWSKGKNYISERFDLVFVIALRTFKGDLSSHLVQQCEGVEGSEDMKMKAIKLIEKKVLLLLDGLDEIPTGEKKSLYRLFKGNNYPLMTVVVTCRTGFFPKVKSSDNTFQATVNKGFQMDFVWDKRVEIQGISYWDRLSFIQKYLNIDYEALKEKLDELDLLRNKLYECPLFLLILAVLIQEKEIRQIKTKTELYKTIFNFVINRGLVKLKGERKEIDVFDLKSETDEFGCRNLLLYFGRLCLEKMKKQSLIFEESELLKCSDGNGDQDLILKLGFLSKQITFFSYEEKEHYEPIHRSFLEFSAAFFLSSFDGLEQEVKKKIGKIEKFEKLVLEFDIWPKEDQLLYIFLGGLLNDNAFKLFNALSAFKRLITIFDANERIYHNYGYNLETVLLEIHPTEEIIKSLGNLYTGDWRNVKYKNSLHMWYVELLKYGTNYDEILTVNVSEFLDVINEFSYIQINTVHVNIDEEATNLRCRNIQCLHLKITMTKFLKDSALILKEIIKKINAEEISLEINCSDLRSLQVDDYQVHVILFFKEISQFDFLNCNFYYLSVVSVSSSLWLSISPYIQTLIKQRKIEFGVHVGFLVESYPIKNDFSSFVETVFKSHLQSFKVENYYGNVQFPITFFDDENQIQYISLTGNFEETNDDEMESISLLQLIFNAYPKSFLGKLLMKKCGNVKGLSCDVDFICQLGDDDYVCEWKGFDTVVQLGIYKWRIGMLNTESFRKGISLFQNVQQLCLIDAYVFIVNIKFIADLPSLKRIYFDNVDIDFLKELLVLNEQKGESGLGLEELEIREFSFDPNSWKDIMKCIEDCFLKKVFFLFSISYSNKFLIRFFFKYFHFKDEFKLSYRIEKQSHDIFEINNVKFCLEKLK